MGYNKYTKESEWLKAYEPLLKSIEKLEVFKTITHTLPNETLALRFRWHLYSALRKRGLKEFVEVKRKFNKILITRMDE